MPRNIRCGEVQLNLLIDEDLRKRFRIMAIRKEMHQAELLEHIYDEYEKAYLKENGLRNIEEGI